MDIFIAYFYTITMVDFLKFHIDIINTWSPFFKLNYQTCMRMLSRHIVLDV